MSRESSSAQRTDRQNPIDSELHSQTCSAPHAAGHKRKRLTDCDVRRNHNSPAEILIGSSGNRNRYNETKCKKPRSSIPGSVSVGTEPAGSRNPLSVHSE